VPLPHLREIRPDVIQGNVAGPGRLGGVVRGLFQHDQHGPGLHRGARRHRHLAHQAGGRGPHLVLHLHRLDDEQFVAGGDRAPGRGRDRNHGAGQRRPHRGVAGRHRHRGRDQRHRIGGRGHGSDRAGRDEFGGVGVDPAHLEQAEPGRLQHRPQQRLEQGHVGGHPGDVELGQRPQRPAGRLLERSAVGDHLGQQRVVVRADGVTRVAGGVDAHAAPRRGPEPAQRAGAGSERAVGPQGLGVDPDLDRGAARVRAQRQGRQRQGRQRRAVGDTQPELDQVQAGDLLGDRVLDLQARVDFSKGDRVVLDEELHGGQPGVVGRPGQRQRRLGQPLADRVRDRGRRDLDQLLPPPLQTAVTITQHGYCAGAVADDLDLHVPGSGQQPLDVDPPVAEGRRRLGGAPAHRPGEIGLARHRPQAAPAAAGDRLDHDRAVLAQQGPRLLQRGVAVGAGQDGHAQLASPGPGGALVAEQRERAGRGTGEAHPGLGAARGQLRPLRCEAVPGMQHVTARAGGRGDDRIDVKVGRRTRSRQLDRRVGPADVAAGGVVGGIDRDRLDPEHGRRRHDADGDLAPVGDEQSLDHRPGVLSSLGSTMQTITTQVGQPGL